MAKVGGHFDKVVFVFSTGRTATTAIAHYINNAYKNVVFLHEPSPKYRLRLASHRYLAGRLTREQMVKKFVAARKQLYSGIKTSTYIEVGFTNGFLDVMDDVFDEPLIVHITRDARTFVRSALNWGALRGLKGTFTQFVPYWTIKPQNIDANSPLRWSAMTPVARWAWFWQLVNGHLDRGAELFGDRYLRVKFEDLIKPNADGLRAMCDWVGLTEIPGKLEPLVAKKVNASRGHDMPDWSQWSDDDRGTVMQHCAPLMRKYGYLE